jgi:hypothetical protein
MTQKFSITLISHLINRNTEEGYPHSNIWSTIGSSESQILTWILLCTPSQPTWMSESVILSSPDGPDSLTIIWGTKYQRRHRGHILLQSESPTDLIHSRDTLTVISSITGNNRCVIVIRYHINTDNNKSQKRSNPSPTKC